MCVKLVILLSVTVLPPTMSKHPIGEAKYTGPKPCSISSECADVRAEQAALNKVTSWKGHLFDVQLGNLMRGKYDIDDIDQDCIPQVS